MPYLSRRDAFKRSLAGTRSRLLGAAGEERWVRRALGLLACLLMAAAPNQSAAAGAPAPIAQRAAAPGGAAMPARPGKRLADASASKAAVETKGTPAARLAADSGGGPSAPSASNPADGSKSVPAGVPATQVASIIEPANAGEGRPVTSSRAAAPFGLLDPKSWPFTFIPVPEVATDPNQGTTIGVLPVLLFNNDQHQIRSIFAPDINYNTNIGVGGTARYLAYPSANTQWYAIGGASRNIARRVDLFYSTGRTHQELWSLEGRFYFERDPTERFFGIGNQTTTSTETNFTTEQVYAQVLIGLNLGPHLQVALVEKPRRVRIMRGALTNLRFIRARFPNVKGINGGTDFMNRLMVSYDTRDSMDIPRHGGLARIFGNVSDRHLLSSASYTQFGGEVRRYMAVNDRVTLAGHVFLQYTPAGNEAPFWARARLGGEDSLLTDQQTLRGYGAGRFIDNNLSVANLEVRTRVYNLDVFDTHGILELAPFVEAGKVFHTVRDNPVDRMHPVGGIGFRGIAEPFVVGYVDVGYGGGGTSVFSGINYPF